jgi:hypothetical protein
VTPGIWSVLFVAVAVPAGAQYTLDWRTVDGGGATECTGGAYTLSGTIGQPDAGRSSGSGYTLGGGFWMGGAVVVGADEADALAAAVGSLSLRLHPAAPNPLVGRTMLTFDLPDARPVRVSVYDVAGRLVRTLNDGPLLAGRHHREWNGAGEDGRRVAAGVYFFRVDAGPNGATQKVAVVR